MRAFGYSTLLNRIQAIQFINSDTFLPHAGGATYLQDNIKSCKVTVSDDFAMSAVGTENLFGAVNFVHAKV